MASPQAAVNALVEIAQQMSQAVPLGAKRRNCTAWPWCLAECSPSSVVNDKFSHRKKYIREKDAASIAKTPGDYSLSWRAGPKFIKIQSIGHWLDSETCFSLSILEDLIFWNLLRLQKETCFPSASIPLIGQPFTFYFG